MNTIGAALFFLAALALGATVKEALRRACEAGRSVAMIPETWPEG